MKRVLIVALSVLLTMLIPAASAVDATIYFTETYMVTGTVTDGNLASLQSTDADTLNMTEDLVDVTMFTYLRYPAYDNVTDSWGTTCNSYWSCLDDSLTDYNGTFVWTINAGIANLTMGITDWGKYAIRLIS